MAIAAKQLQQAWRRSWRVSRPTGFSIFFILVLATVVVSPVGALFYGAFKEAPPGSPGTFGLSGFAEAYSDPASWNAAWTSLWLAVARMVAVIPITVFLAWAITRTDMPLRGLMESLIISHIFLPFLPLAMSWAVLGSPRAGLLNVLLRTVPGIEGPTGPINMYSYTGLVFLSFLGIPTILYLLIAPAFRSMDASLEESSRMSGASPFTTLRRITIPILAPAILGVTILAFVRALQSFEPELILGTPAGIYVFSNQIYAYLVDYTTPRYGPATALGMVFLAVTFVLVVMQGRVLAGKRFVTVSGRGFRTQPLLLGRWKYVVLAIVALHIFASTILPFGTLTLASFMKIFGYFGQDWFTLRHYQLLFETPKFLRSVQNTLIMAGGAATLGMLVTTLTSYMVTRTRARGKHVLDFLTWLPLTVPGIVLAVGFIWAYVGLVQLPFRLYGSIYLLILAIAVTSLPNGGRVMNSTMIQIGAELEESSRVHGASWLRTFRSVLLPLLRPGIISGWLILFALAVKDFVTVSILYSPSSVVVAAYQFELWNGGESEAAAALGVLNMAFSILLILAYSHLRRRENSGA